MQLTVPEVARYFKVSEKTIHRWIATRNMPARREGNLCRFNRAELLEWAAFNKIEVDPSFFNETANGDESLPDLAGALKAGGFLENVGGEDKQTVLRNVVERLPLPEGVGRDFLFQVLWAREALESTAIGDGIAIPHARNPIVLRVSRPQCTLCYLARPVDFGALDGQPVFALFVLVSTTVRVHLHLLARLAYALRNEHVRELVRRRVAGDQFIEAVSRLQTGMGVEGTVKKEQQP